MIPVRRIALIPVALLTLTLAACGSTATATETASSQTTPSDPASALTVTDPWAKAADEGMTAAFAVLSNDSDTDITIVSASSDVSAMELHEMAMNDDGDMVMRPKEGGIVVPAHGEHELAPGGDHVMFMELSTPLEPGADVDITLTGEDGAQWTVTFPVRTFTGAQEDYEPEAGSMDDMGSEHDD